MLSASGWYHDQLILNLRTLFKDVWTDLNSEATMVFVHTNPWIGIDGAVEMEEHRVERDGLVFVFTADRRVRPTKDEVVYLLVTQTEAGDQVLTIHLSEDTHAQH